MSRRQKKRVSKAVQEAEEKLQVAGLVTVAKILESSSTSFSNAVEDPDEDQWDNVMDVGKDGRTLVPEKYYDMIAKCRELYRTNLHARAIIRNFVKYIIGRGMTFKPNAKLSDEEVKKVNDYWALFCRTNKMGKRFKEIVKRVFRDGESILRFFSGDENGEDADVPRVRFIEPTIVKDPEGNHSFGIQTDEDDVETVLNYLVVDENGRLDEVIPADEVLHFKLDSDSDVKRGIPLHQITWKRLRRYDTWLEDRIILNKIRTAVALLKKIPGLTAAKASSIVSNTRTSQGTDPRTGETINRKRIRGGGIFHVPAGVDYEFLSPNVDAKDVAVDGRAILLSIAAGVEQAEFMVTADAGNANYGSTMQSEAPAIRGFEDYQSSFAEDFEEVWVKVMEYGDCLLYTSPSPRD